MIELDGSFGEGGGQILRSSLALSLITGKPFHIRNIRARRPKPGLHPQHLASVKAAGELGQAKLVGATLHSSELRFEPGPVAPGNYHFRIGTAGATGLVLHTVYLPLALADGPSAVTIEGGTHVTTSPCFDFLDTTWRAYMLAIGLKVNLTMRRPGFYPRGGGLIQATFPGNAKLHGLNLQDVGSVDEAEIISVVAGLPEKIAERQSDRAMHRLRRLKLRATVTQRTWHGGPGTVLAISLPTTPAPTLFFGLGARGKPAERVADEAVDQVEEFLEASPLGVDAHSADQLPLPLALAQGPSMYRVACVTRHLLTNLHVIGMFLERETFCEGGEGEPGTVRIT